MENVLKYYAYVDDVQTKSVVLKVLPPIQKKKITFVSTLAI